MYLTLEVGGLLTQGRRWEVVSPSYYRLFHKKKIVCLFMIKNRIKSLQNSHMLFLLIIWNLRNLNLLGIIRHDHKRESNCWVFASITCSRFSFNYLYWWVRLTHVTRRVPYYSQISPHDSIISSYWWVLSYLT